MALPVTKHDGGCQMAFGRKDPACARCQELIAGAEPRGGWQKAYFANKARTERIQREASRKHFEIGGPHDRGLCGPVCTFGDW